MGSTPAPKSPEKSDREPDRLARDLERILNRSAEERAAMTERSHQIIRPGRPLPPGKTLQDVVSGKWPGPETDAEILAALNELS